MDVNGRPRIACRARVREGDKVSAPGTLPVLRDMVARRDGVARQLRGRVPNGVHGNDLDVAAPADYHALTACIECYACLDNCPMHARNFADGVEQRDENDAYRWGNPFSLLKLQRIRLDPAASPAEKADALEAAQDLGLATCRDCPGCKCGVGIDLKRKVIKPLLETAKQEINPELWWIRGGDPSAREHPRTAEHVSPRLSICYRRNFGQAAIIFRKGNLGICKTNILCIGI